MNCLQFQSNATHTYTHVTLKLRTLKHWPDGGQDTAVEDTRLQILD